MNKLDVFWFELGYIFSIYNLDIFWLLLFEYSNMCSPLLEDNMSYYVLFLISANAIAWGHLEKIFEWPRILQGLFWRDLATLRHYP